MFGDDVHGGARWANTLDVIASGLSGGGGLFLGKGGGLDLFHKGEEHVLTIAPPGSGKTTSLVLPTLLTYPGSVVVTDPKGALTAQTMRRRREMGQHVVVLNPWRRELAAGTGIDLGDTGFNPLLLLEDTANLRDNCQLLGQLLLPPVPGETNPYWRNGGRTIIVACLLYMARTMTPEQQTLPRLRTLVRAPEEVVRAMVEEMAGDDHQTLRDYAAEFLGLLDAKEQWTGVRSKAWEATDIYAAGEPLGDHVSRYEFDPADLKRQPMTVYVVVPAHRREANKGWLSLVMALMGEAVGRPGPARPVLLLLEEFANLGMMPTIYRALAEYREAGLRCWLICQTMGQLQRLYGRDGAAEILGLCQVKQFFKVEDLELARSLSATIGQRTVTHRPAFDFTSPGTPMGVPLIRPEEIMLLPPDRQVILRGAGVPPISGRLVPYFKRKEWAALADPNPYRV